MSIKRLFHNILHTIHSTYLCIRYPFLYPRNRFTGLHYNNWKIHDYHVKHYKNCVHYVVNEIISLKEFKKQERDLTLKGFGLVNYRDNLFVECKNGNIILRSGHKIVEMLSVKKIVYEYGANRIMRFGLVEKFSSAFLIIVVDEITKDDSSKNKVNTIQSYVVDKKQWLKVKMLDIINDYVLQVFHCIPTYTEWDALEKGWKIAFGKQMLKDIKKQLIKDKMLYSFRILDIKEKYGSLRVYTGPSSREMQQLLNKYEDISYHTCIICGKPAKYLSNGWICPYCEDHFDINKQKPLAIIDEKGEWKYIEDENEEQDTNNT